MEDRIIREKERKKLTGVSRTTWWRLASQGLAPKSRKLSQNSIGWLQSELMQWIKTRGQGV